MINAAQALEAVEPGAARELIIRLDAGEPPSIHIIDTGPGMTEEQTARAFEPYFTTKAGGTGLGLPTTRRIVEAHDGTLSLDSQPGRGTAFTITLPQARDAASESASEPESRDAPPIAGA
jgi:signal transduction histidine kinase